jgi:hypothetical protein
MFEELEHLGIVQRSSSQWSSPLHMVSKPKGSWRPCGNYRRLNDVTISEKNPLPNLHDLSAHLHGSTIFLKLDLEKGFRKRVLSGSHGPPKMFQKWQSSSHSGSLNSNACHLVSKMQPIHFIISWIQFLPFCLFLFG